jgi:hypothetical protein
MRKFRFAEAINNWHKSKSILFLEREDKCHCISYVKDCQTSLKVLAYSWNCDTECTEAEYFRSH